MLGAQEHGIVAAPPLSCMTIPTHCGMPPLTQNIEGLRSHSLLIGIFMPEPKVAPEARKWRSWLVHCLAKAARHYNDARRLILAQIAESQRPPSDLQQGRWLPIFDFSLEMEDCITSVYKLSDCIWRLEANGSMPKGRLLVLDSERDALIKMRNKQEHIQNYLAAGQAVPGPIFVALEDDGEGIVLIRDRMSFSALYSLIDAAYRDLASLFPAFPIDSLPGATGSSTLSVTVAIDVIEPGKPSHIVE